MLKQSEIYSRGIIVVKLTEVILLQQLLDLLNRSGKQERVIDHDFEIFLLCEVDQLCRLSNVARERLFHKNMFPVLECCFGQFKVSPYRSYYGDHVDLRRRDHLGSVRAHVDTRVSLVSSFARSRTLVAHRHDFHTTDTVEVPHHVWSPIPPPDYPYLDQDNRLPGNRIKLHRIGGSYGAGEIT